MSLPERIHIISSNFRLSVLPRACSQGKGLNQGRRGEALHTCLFSIADVCKSFCDEANKRNNIGKGTVNEIPLMGTYHMYGIMCVCLERTYSSCDGHTGTYCRSAGAAAAATYLLPTALLGDLAGWSCICVGESNSLRQSVIQRVDQELHQHFR